MDHKLKKNCKKRQSTSLCNSKGITSIGRCNNYKLYATIIKAPKCMKQTLTELKQGIRNNSIIGGNGSNSFP